MSSNGEQKIFYLYKRSLNTVFFQGQDYQYYLRLINKYKTSVSLKLLAFCVLPDELHLIVMPDSADRLAQFFDKVDQAYRVHYRNRYQAEYSWDESNIFEIDAARELTHFVHYLEFLPVERSLAVSPAYYEWSSYSRRIRGNGGMLDIRISDIVESVLEETKVKCSSRLLPDTGQ